MKNNILLLEYLYKLYLKDCNRKIGIYTGSGFTFTWKKKRNNCVETKSYSN